MLPLLLGVVAAVVAHKLGAPGWVAWLAGVYVTLAAARNIALSNIVAAIVRGRD